LSKVHTDDGFNPNAYKLMKTFDNDFKMLASLGRVVEAKCYGINET